MAEHGYLGDGYGTYGQRGPDGDRDRNRGSSSYDRDNDRGGWMSSDRDYDRSSGYGRDNDRGGWMSSDRDNDRDHDRSSGGIFGSAHVYGRDPDDRQARTRYGNRERDHDDNDRGFFEWIGREVSSWFGGGRDDDDRGRGSRSNRDYGATRSYSDSDRDRGYGRYGGEGRQRAGGAFTGSPAGNYGRGDYGRSDYGRGRESGQSGSPGRVLVYEEVAVVRPSANPDDHYRSWRDRQMQQLDRDYEDYCREREQQFHQEFGQWRSSRRQQGSDSGNSRMIGQSGTTGEAGTSGTTASSNEVSGSRNSSRSRSTTKSGTGGSAEGETVSSESSRSAKSRS